MSIAPTKSKGRHHQARTRQFFTKSREPLYIKIAAALHLVGLDYEFVATFDHTNTKQITIAINKIRNNMTDSFMPVTFTATREIKSTF